MCKKLPSDAADFVMEAVPLLTNLLQYHDSKARLQSQVLEFTLFNLVLHCLMEWKCLQVLEHASVCLTRIAEAFASSPEKLDELCNHGLVGQAASLISISNSGGGQASLSTPTYTVGVIQIFGFIVWYMGCAVTLSLAGFNSSSINLCKRLPSGSKNIASPRDQWYP